MHRRVSYSWHRAVSTILHGPASYINGLRRTPAINIFKKTVVQFKQIAQRLRHMFCCNAAFSCNCVKSELALSNLFGLYKTNKIQSLNLHKTASTILHRTASTILHGPASTILHICRKLPINICKKSVFVGIFVCTPAFGSAYKNPVYTNSAIKKPVHSPSVSREIKKQLKHSIKNTVKNSGILTKNLGIMIKADQQLIYGLNVKKSFVPASLTKIFTAGALLDLLPPALKFSTWFLADKQPVGGQLTGNLYLKGGGDPAFVSESLWNLVNHLTRTHLKEVEGDLVLDDTRFDRVLRGKRLAPSDRSYDSPVSALSFNWSVANIYVRPGKQAGSKADVTIDPSDLYFSFIQNKTRTLAAGNTTNIRIKRGPDCNKNSFLTHVRFSKNAGKLSPSTSPGRICIHGKMPLNYPEILFYKNIAYPTLWTGWNAIAFLKQRGINIQGNIRRGKTPPHTVPLASWHGKTLTENIRLMMKHSNNFMVEMMVKNLALYEHQTKWKHCGQNKKKHRLLWEKEVLKNAKKKFTNRETKKAGSLKTGLKFIRQHIQHCLKIPTGRYSLIQPSGLSQKNHFQPRHLMMALEYWNKHPLQPEFESALPLAAQDGTLKERLTNAPLKVHAKTGHLNGVAGLAGTVRTSNKNKYLFVFIFNGPEKQSSKAKQLFKNLIHLLVTSH